MSVTRDLNSPRGAPKGKPKQPERVPDEPGKPASPKTDLLRISTKALCRKGFPALRSPARAERPRPAPPDYPASLAVENKTAPLEVVLEAGLK